MQKYRLVLTRKANRFTCSRIDGDQNKPIEENSKDLPLTIRDALDCKSHQDVTDFIKCYVNGSGMDSNVSNPELTTIEIDDIIIELVHEVLPQKHQASPTNPTQYVSLTRLESLTHIDRNTQRHQENLQKGRQFQQTPWYHPQLFLLVLEYLYHKCKNIVSASLIGHYLDIHPDHFCEDFDEGRSQIQMNNNFI